MAELNMDNGYSKKEYNDKFLYLGDIPPEIDEIVKLDPKDIEDKHLGTLDEHLRNLQNKFPEISREIDITREKILRVLNSKVNISGEILKVTNY